MSSSRSKEKKMQRRQRIEQELRESAAASAPEPPSDSRTFSAPSSSERAITTPVKYVQAQADDADLRLPNQGYMVLSYVAPAKDKTTCEVGSDHVMIKVSGVFGSEKEASDHAQKVHAQSHHRNLIGSYVVPLYVWLTIPMPQAAEMYTRKIYSEQPVLDKLMMGNWQSTENSRKEVAARVAKAKEANMRKLRAQYGQDYKSPERSAEEVAKEREEMATKPAPATQEEKTAEKAYTLMDIYMMFAKFAMKKSADAGPGTSSAAPEEEPGRFDVKKLTPEIKAQITEFRDFVEGELKKLEDQAKKLEQAQP